MNIAIDFDGTVVTHDYPNIGKDVGAVSTLKEIIKAGHNLMLWTMRSGKTLEAAIKWFEENHIPLLCVNINPEQKWTTSPKLYAPIYIDDAALGCPLKFDVNYHHRPFVDWNQIAYFLVERKIISPV